jgi:adenosylhomocysteine nucleosidase
MAMSASIAIIAAMEREVRSLVKGWPAYSGPSLGAYRSFATGDVLVVCAGIGPRAVRSSVESVLTRFSPSLLISAGLAGALVPELKVGQVITPATVIDTATSQCISTGQGSGILVSAPGVAGQKAKRLLAEKYAAQVVDMEAALVAEAAAKVGVPFVAIKAISDEYDFPVPGMDRFVAPSGRFLTGKFLCHIALRPSLWPVVRQLNVNSKIASRQLCAELRNLIDHARRQSATQSPTTSGRERKVLAR